MNSHPPSPELMAAKLSFRARPQAESRNLWSCGQRLTNRQSIDPSTRSLRSLGRDDSLKRRSDLLVGTNERNRKEGVIPIGPAGGWNKQPEAAWPIGIKGRAHSGDQRILQLHLPISERFADKTRGVFEDTRSAFGKDPRSAEVPGILSGSAFSYVSP